MAVMKKNATDDATRTITALPKITGANTQYYEIADEDSAYIYDWLMRFLTDATEMATHDSELKKAWFDRRPDLFPRGVKGQNSVASMVAGILGAKIRNKRHDLSEPIMDSLQVIFEIIHGLYSSDPNPPQKIKFRRSLFA
jgi:hypothetical protein